MENINYEDFSKLEIKIGTIMLVEEVPDTDKLLRLEVDCGEEARRQIISGIKHLIDDPQSLIGKQCPFVTNMETRKIRGYESQGMIMAAGDADNFAFLHPSKNLESGTMVK